jgi:hypothetical protein
MINLQNIVYYIQVGLISDYSNDIFMTPDSCSFLSIIPFFTFVQKYPLNVLLYCLSQHNLPFVLTFIETILSTCQIRLKSIYLTTSNFPFKRIKSQYTLLFSKNKKLQTTKKTLKGSKIGATSK